MALRGDRVVQLRKALNITQAQLAQRIEVAQNQISRYETGGYNPSIEKLILLAQILNTTTDYLLGLSNIPHPGAEPDPPATLSPAEREMIDTLRQYPEDDKATLVRMVKLAGQVGLPPTER